MNKVTDIKKGKSFSGEILQFTTIGAHDYIGELDTSEHPLGKEWWRIRNPCITFLQQNEEKKSMTQVVANTNGNGAYRKHLDIKAETILEIKTLDKNGPLMKFYRKELSSPPRKPGEKRADLYLPDGLGNIVKH